MNFFARKTQKSALEATFGDRLAADQVAPGTQLHFDGKLIVRLRSHHQALLSLSRKAREAAQASKFDDARKCLHLLRLLLNEHMLEKNLRLYTYLSCCLKADAAGLELTRDIRRETGGISRKAAVFTTHYNDGGINAENRTAFLEELAQITDGLNDCFGREERTLYTMYQPPQAFTENATKPALADEDSDASRNAATEASPQRAEFATLDEAVPMSPREFAPIRRAVA